MKIAILGGGISGLSAAYFLRKKYPEARIELFEKTGRLGGWLETTEVDGFSFERGPRTFVAGRCPVLLGMIRELGLEVVYSATKAKRYLWHGGKLQPLGKYWWLMVGGLMRDCILPGRKREDETIYDFGCRRFGQKMTELLLDPMTKGIFGGDIRKLSMQTCFPTLWENRFAWKGSKDPRLFTLKMQSLVDALSRLDLDFHLNTELSQLPDADLIVSALPAPEISRLTQIPLSIHYAPLTVVNLGYRGSVLSTHGYGYLVPSIENEALLGMIWDTEVFPVVGQTKVTAMVRGDNTKQVAVEAMHRHLGVKQRPAVVLEKLTWLPQYEVGHQLKVQNFQQQLQQKWPNLRLVGNYLQGPSVESCVQSDIREETVL